MSYVELSLSQVAIGDKVGAGSTSAAFQYLYVPTVDTTNPDRKSCVYVESSAPLLAQLGLGSLCGQRTLTKIRFFFFHKGLAASGYQAFLQFNRSAALKNDSAIFWIADPGSITADACDAAGQLPVMLNAPVGQITFVSGNWPLLPGGQGMDNLYLLPTGYGLPSGGENPFYWGTYGQDMYSNSMVLSGYSSACSLIVGRPNALAGLFNSDARSSGASWQYFSLTFIGDNVGALCLPAFVGGFVNLPSGAVGGPSFCYSVLENEPQSEGLPGASAFVYPFLRDQTVLNGLSNCWNIQLNPLALDDPTKSFIVVGQDGYNSPTSPTLKTGFRTLAGETVELTPQLNLSFAFCRTVEGTVYYVPQGRFTMTIEGGAASGKLLCGLSGTEFVEFKSGDTIIFYPGQPAGVEAGVIPGPAARANAAFRLRDDSDFTTAWAMIVPASGAGRMYQTDSSRSPLFTNTDAAHPAELEFFPGPPFQLPGDAGSGPDFNQFPLVPYGALAPTASGFGGQAAYIESFEAQVLAPRRWASIAAMATQQQPSGQQSVVPAVTPQGYEAAFANGGMVALTTARGGFQTPDGANTSVSIEFLGSDPGQGELKALPAALQRAFTTNQQFLVISTNQNLGVFAPAWRMDGWGFTLDLPATTTPGEYKNVLIFKSGGMTVSQMAGSPEQWTERRSFNDASSDPDGLSISNWLVDYLEKARKLYDGGKGVKSLAHFCSIIDDPSWNGFLALKVSPVMNTLPEDVQALLSTIDPNLFCAHHIGNSINHVSLGSPQKDSYDLRSVPFGLVCYVDPVLGPVADHLPPFIPTPQTCDFKVLTLEVLFEKGIIQYFSNKNLLVMNELFGDKVVMTGQGRNNMVIIGTRQLVDGLPVFTFQTGKGNKCDFLLSSRAFSRIQVTQGTMDISGTPGNFRASFRLDGNIRLLNDPNFDLLSYHYLVFSGLTLSIKMAQKEDPVFDSASLLLALNQNTIAGPGNTPDRAENQVRAGSLLSQFPLTLKSFVVGGKDLSPEQMGYRLLETRVPAGVSWSPPSGEAWYGLEFDLALGESGVLSSSAVIGASLLLAWAPGGNGVPAAAPMFKLSGPAGASLGFDVEGVVKFGAKGILLNQEPAVAPSPFGPFVLIFESIALSVLSLSFPPKGTTNLVLIGDTAAGATGGMKPTLGWFGGYKAKTVVS